MANIATAGQNRASRGLRFFFAPQLLGTGSLEPLRNILVGFVQLIAQFLAAADLIPATHRSLRPRCAADARLGEVIALAWFNLRRPGTRLDQYSVFGAVIALFALLAMLAAYTAFTLLIGSAHAAITITFSFAACTTAGTFFTSGCTDGDMAQQWIDALLLAQTPWWVAQTNLITPQMQVGLGAMFQTYSYAMLVLAGFLVLYHLLIVIAGTAHEGRLGGKIMNQIWAPIRLIAAIGMLVPIGLNGLNAGQMIAIQVTKWGSGLASNTWIAFTTAFTDSAYVILPPIPQSAGVVQNALKVLVCQTSYERVARDIESVAGAGTAFRTGVEGWYYTGPSDAESDTIHKNWYYQKNGGGLNDKEYNLCGNIEMLNPNYAPRGTAAQFLSTTAGLDASFDLRRAVLTAQRNAIDALMQFSLTGDTQTGGRLAQLADKLYQSADSANTNYVLTVGDILEFNLALGEYRLQLATDIRNAVAASATLAGINMTADARSRGWLSAGVWFNTIAKINGMLVDYAKALPSVNFNYKPLLDENLVYRTNIAFASADDIIAQLPDMAAVSGTPLNEPLSFLKSVDGNGSPMDSYLLQLAGRIKGILGNTTGSADEIAAGGLPAFASGLTLNSANPLAELSALGHRMVEASFAVNDAVGKCYQSIGAERQRQSNASTAMGPANPMNNACADASGLAPGPAMFLMQAISGAMVMAGITLAFVLPLLPFIRFLFGILTWVIAVFETVIAIPIVALAHIRMDGDGFAGQSARSAYLLLLQVFLRPVLMIFGLMIALLVFNLMIVALNEFYSQAVRSAEGGGSVSALAAVVYTVVYVALAYGLANASFKAIDMVPNQCLMWIGGAVQQGMDGTGYVSNAVGQTAGIARSASDNLAQIQARSLMYR